MSVDGLSFKKLYNPTRDVDHAACLRLLLKYKADTQMRSPSGKIPIFKALKSSVMNLQLILEYDTDRIRTINTINKKGMSPLCKLAGQKSSEENFQKINLLLKAGASCSLTAPKYHPL